MTDEARSLRSFPLPVKRGEGGERRSREPGEGPSRRPHMPLTRLASLGTLSPFHGERESKGET
jgi:hypothetical protein